MSPRLLCVQVISPSPSTYTQPSSIMPKWCVTHTCPHADRTHYGQKLDVLLMCCDCGCRLLSLRGCSPSCAVYMGLDVDADVDIDVDADVVADVLSVCVCVCVCVCLSLCSVRVRRFHRQGYQRFLRIRFRSALTDAANGSYHVTCFMCHVM